MDFEASLNLAQRLSAYIPTTLTRQLLTNGLPVAGEPYPQTAATLFADMSGFTAMSEDLASDGLRGAEEVNRVLLLTFTGMIDLIHRAGGAISHFYGDAMSVYFPDDDGGAAHRAVSCAQMMQVLMMTSFNRVVTNRPQNKDPFFNLSMKVGVGYGTCQALVVGSPELGMEFVLTGQAVDEATDAEHHATAGDVVASRSALAQVGIESERPFAIIENILPMPAEHLILQWENYDQTACERLIENVKPFIPPTIYNRLLDTEAPNLAEHRPASSLFVQFEFEGAKDSSDIEYNIGQQLNEYYLWASQVVRRFGAQNARVNRVLTGDKGNQLHIIFGAPVAPDAPDQAGRCALALQRERPSYVTQQHIGFTAGKVFAGPVGSDARREYTIVGAMVNLSARLMQHCPPDAVWTDRHTAQRLHGQLELEELPSVDLKGKGETVPIKILRDKKTSGGQINSYMRHWQQPQVGRDDELIIMQELMQEALAGKGNVLRVWGNTGVGKTRFIADGVRQWLEADGEVMIGSCQPHTEDVAFTPWQHIWRTFFGLHGGMNTDEQVQAVISYMRTLVPEMGEEVGLWADLLGLPIPQTETLSELTAEVRQVRLFHLMRRCLKETTQQHPFLLVLEDLHWADQASLKLVDELAKYIEEWRGMIILTHRPVILPLATIDAPICTSIKIGDISASDGRELLRQLLGQELLPAIVEQHLGLRDREGRDSPVSPLFLEEALQMMVSQGVLSHEAGQLSIDEDQLRDLPVPDSIHSLLLARLDRLPANNRDLLQVASVIGRQFTLESLDKLTPAIARSVVNEMIESLSAEQITQFVSQDPEWTYLFQHAMTHEVVYESLPFDRRQGLHEAVADWLVERYGDNLRPLYALLAYHYTQAKTYEKGLTYALKAANAARDIFANEEAVDLYTLAESHLQSLGLEERWETAVTIYLERTNLLRYIGDFKKGYLDAEKALGMAKKYNNPFYMARAYNFMAELCYRQADVENAKRYTQEVILHLTEEATTDELACAYHWYGMSQISESNLDLALESLKKAEKLWTKINNKKRLATALEAIAYVYFSLRKLESALDAMQKSFNLYHEYSIPANVASALNNISIVQLKLGQASQALESCNQAIEIASYSSKNFLARCLGHKAEVLFYLGSFDEGKHVSEKAIQLFEEMDDKEGLADILVVLGYDYYTQIDDWQLAQKYLQKVKDLMDSSLINYIEIQTRVLLGQVNISIANRDYAQAKTLLSEIQTLIMDKKLIWWEPSISYFKGLLYLHDEKKDKALDCFLTVEEQSENGGSPEFLAISQLEAAKLNEGQNKINYLIKSLKSALARSRYINKRKCYEFAINYRNRDEDLDKVLENLEKSLDSQINKPRL